MEAEKGFGTGTTSWGGRSSKTQCLPMGLGVASSCGHPAGRPGQGARLSVPNQQPLRTGKPVLYWAAQRALGALLALLSTGTLGVILVLGRQEGSTG